MRLLIAFLLILTAGPRAQAQDREHAPIVLTLPSSTRALSMGNAFPIGSPEASAVFYNPAMSEVSGVSLDIQRYGGEGTTVSLAGGVEWWGGWIGAGLQAAEYGVPPSALTGGYGERALAEGGAADVAEHVAVVAYATRIKGLRMSLSGRLIDQRAAGEKAATGALDVSTGLTLRGVNIGLAVQNIGGDYDFLGSEHSPPLRVTAGAALARSAPVGPMDLMLAAALSRETDGTVVPGAGVEIGYWPIQGRTFFFRAGLRDPADEDTQPWTAGLGFSGDAISLDYAVIAFDGASASHRLTLRWRE